MESPSSRREFFAHTGAAAYGLLAAAGAVGALGTSLAMPSTARAIEPIQRRGGPKFKFSLAAYSYGSLLSGSNPKMTLFEFIDLCAGMQLEGTELTGYYFPKDPDNAALHKISHHCFLQGLDISGTATRNELCHPAGPRRDREIEHLKRWVNYAATLGTRVIRIFAGKVQEGQAHAEAHRLAVEAIEECCDYAGQHGVFLALENHGGITTNADEMLAIVRDVKSPWFGVNFDSGNFRTRTAYDDLAKIAPYTINAQIKVNIVSPSGENGPADYSRLAKVLRDAGYRGYVVLEYEGPNPLENCPRHMDELRAAFA